jgi:hypothetical protein
MSESSKSSVGYDIDAVLREHIDDVLECPTLKPERPTSVKQTFDDLPRDMDQYEDALQKAYDEGRRDGAIEQSLLSSRGGQANGVASRVSPEVSAAAAELADLVLGMQGVPARALAVAATLSGLLGTTGGKPLVVSPSVVTTKDLVVGGVYIGHIGSETFEWEYLGRMPNDCDKIRLRRAGCQASVEFMADHGLVGGGPKGHWTESTGLTRDGIERALSATVQTDDELPEGEDNVLGT